MEILFYIFMVIVGVVALIYGVMALTYLWAIFAVIRDSFRKSRDKRRERKRIQRNYGLVESAEENTASVLAELNALPDEKARIECLRRHSDIVFLTDSWYWMYIEPFGKDPEVQIIIIGYKDLFRFKGSISLPLTMDFGGLTLHTSRVLFGQRLKLIHIPESLDIAKACGVELFQVPEQLRYLSDLTGFPRLKTFKVPATDRYPYYLISDCKELETVELCDEWPSFAISHCPKLRKLIFPSYQSFLDRYASYIYERQQEYYEHHCEYEETMKALFETGVNPDSGIELSIEFSNGDSFSELHVPDPNEKLEEYKTFVECSREVLPNRVKRIVFPENLRLVITYFPDGVSIDPYDEIKKGGWEWDVFPDEFPSLESVTFPNEVWIEDWDAEDGQAIFSDYDDDMPFVRLTPANSARHEKLLGFKINLKS